MVDHYLLAHLADPNSEMAMIRAAHRGCGSRQSSSSTMRCPILAGGQFDALRHGHFSYLLA